MKNASGLHCQVPSASRKDPQLSPVETSEEPEDAKPELTSEAFKIVETTPDLRAASSAEADTTATHDEDDRVDTESHREDSLNFDAFEDDQDMFSAFAAPATSSHRLSITAKYLSKERQKNLSQLDANSSQPSAPQQTTARVGTPPEETEPREATASHTHSKTAELAQADGVTEVRKNNLAMEVLETKKRLQRMGLIAASPTLGHTLASSSLSALQSPFSEPSRDTHCFLDSLSDEEPDTEASERRERIAFLTAACAAEAAVEDQDTNEQPLELLESMLQCFDRVVQAYSQLTDPEHIEIYNLHLAQMGSQLQEMRSDRGQKELEETVAPHQLKSATPPRVNGGLPKLSASTPHQSNTAKSLTTSESHVTTPSTPITFVTTDENSQNVCNQAAPAMKRPTAWQADKIPESFEQYPSMLRKLACLLEGSCQV